MFVLRVMTGLIILYDHVHPTGVFVKPANVDVSDAHTPYKHEFNLSELFIMICEIHR